MSQLGLNPIQQLFLARLERLLALPGVGPRGPLDSSGVLVQRAIASTFGDCLGTGVGLEAMEPLHSWLQAAARGCSTGSPSPEDSDDHTD